MLDILELIRNKSINLTKSHQKIVHYITNNTNTVAFSTLQDVALKVGVSTTTVIRFARELGYDGYSDMQNNIRENIMMQMTLPEKFVNTLDNVNDNDLLLKSFNQDLENINLTLHELKEKDLQQAIKHITTANNIYVLGLRESYAMAHYMMSRLSCIKDNVNLIHSVGGLFAEEIIHIKEGDVCIAYLFPRYTQATLDILLELKNKKISVVLITSPGYIDLTNLANIILPCHISGLSYKNTSAAIICLTNYIANAVASTDSKCSLDILNEIENMFSNGSYLG